MRELLLQHGRFHAAVCPELGGALMRLEMHGDAGSLPLLRPASADTRDMLQTACFPMLPFCGRVRDGRFTFRSREIALPPIPDQGIPLHGLVWRLPWLVDVHEDDRLVIHCDHPASAWPWPFRATQEFALGPDGLTITLSASNTGSEAMPCGLGLHPYFNCNADTRLTADVTRHVQMDAQVIPLGDAAITAVDNLQQRAIHRLGLDDSYEGWNGVATIEYPAQGLCVQLSTPDASRLHVYAPVDGDYCCIEAMSHRIDAFHLAEVDFPRAGMRVLEPGASMSLQLRIALSQRPD